MKIKKERQGCCYCCYTPYYAALIFHKLPNRRPAEPSLRNHELIHKINLNKNRKISILFKRANGHCRKHAAQKEKGIANKHRNAQPPSDPSSDLKAKI